jgi:hypothetical protein
MNQTLPPLAAVAGASSQQLSMVPWVRNILDSPWNPSTWSVVSLFFFCDNAFQVLGFHLSLLRFLVYILQITVNMTM